MRQPDRAEAVLQVANTLARSSSACSGPASVAGSTVRRSRPPLPSRTTISLRMKSTSLTRSRSPSISRIPVPYSRRATTPARPSIPASSDATSRRESTVGTRAGRLARTTSSIHGRRIPSTSRYRNSSADRAWFWVLAATPPSTASVVRNRSTSTAPIVRGWRLPLARMNRRIHPR